MRRGAGGAIGGLPLAATVAAPLSAAELRDNLSTAIAIQLGFPPAEAVAVADYVMTLEPSPAREYLEGFLPSGPAASKCVDELTSGLAQLRLVPAAAAPEAPVAAPAPALAIAAAPLLIDDGDAEEEATMRSWQRDAMPTAGDPTRAVYCDCQAARHALFCNCVRCGLVICEAGAARRCNYCGARLSAARGVADERLLVVRERAMSAAASTDSTTAHAAAAPASAGLLDASLAAALRHKDALLDFQRNSAQRTQVLDNEDFDAEAHSVWLSAEERNKAAASAARRTAEMTTRRATSRVALDFSSSGEVRVVDEDAVAERTLHARMHEAAVTGAPAMQRKAEAQLPSPPSTKPLSLPATAAAMAAADAHTWQALPVVGTGVFTNCTLHGRAAAIYAGLRVSLAADGGVK